MRTANFRHTVLSGRPLAGTFLKTPSYQIIEVLAQSRLDFACLDAEHAPFDRQAIDACMAVARALDFPLMVRVGDGSAREILWALDCGAAGVVVPHVDTAAKAADVARAARYGLNGRGYAGSTRSAGYATRKMPEVLKDAEQTVVFAQIEEPAGVEAAEAIARTDGIDGLFVGPADLSVGYGYDHQTSEELQAAMHKVGQITKDTGKAYVSWVVNAAQAEIWAKTYGISVFFIGSEHGWMRNGANADADGVHAIT